MGGYQEKYRKQGQGCYTDLSSAFSIAKGF